MGYLTVFCLSGCTATKTNTLYEQIHQPDMQSVQSEIDQATNYIYQLKNKEANDV